MVKHIKNANLLADGTVFKYLQVIPETMVLTDIGYLRIHNWKGLLKICLSHPFEELPKESFVLIHNSYKGYFHWILESLPRLLQIGSELSNVTLFLPEWANEEFYTLSAKLLGVKKFMKLQQGKVYKLQNLLLPVSYEALGNFSESAIVQLRKALQSAVNYNSSQNGIKKDRKLYISRRKATRRKVLNESEVIRCVSKFGYEIVCLEDFSFEQQLVLCSEAVSFIGIHGAGLSNIFLMPKGASVIELRKFDDGINYTYERLAQTLGYAYYLQYCRADNELLSVQDADIFVDVSELARIISSL